MRPKQTVWNSEHVFVNVCLHQWQLPTHIRRRKKITENWSHHHRPYNYSIQSIDNVCACATDWCISVNRKKANEKKRESILCVFSGGSTTCNFIQFSFLLFVEMRTATASPTTCSSNNNRNQWIFYLFVYVFLSLSHVIETNSYTWARSQLCRVHERIELTTRPLLLPHVNMCTICSAGSREYEKNPCEFYSQLIKLFFVFLQTKQKIAQNVYTLGGCATPRSFQKRPSARRRVCRMSSKTPNCTHT